MIRGIASQIGKATKRSRFGNNAASQSEGTLRAAEFCIKSGFSFHLIDAELPENYLSATELERLLDLSEESESSIATYVTVSARHEAAPDLVEQYVEVLAKHANGGLCLVAGNPAYLSESERQQNATLRTKELVILAREKLPSAPIFLGIEGLSDEAAKLACEYGLTPFMLLDGSMRERANTLRGCCDLGLGVYCPSLLSWEDNARLTIRFLGPYALRRRWVRENLRQNGLRVPQVRSEILGKEPIQEGTVSAMLDIIKELALLDVKTLRGRLDSFSSIGVRYVALLPSTEQPEELEKLSAVTAGYESE